MKPDQQPHLPFSNAPIDWTQPVECRFNQLRDVVAAANRAGFEPVRLACITGGYKVTFQRIGQPDAITSLIETSRNHFATTTQPTPANEKA